MSKRVFVCGAGHQGLSMAAHLSLNGVKVSLWNRTEDNIKDIINNKKIYCEGIFKGTAVLDRVSANISDVISDFIMVTTPSNAHKDIAKVLAPYVHKDMIIILNPGRTYGAFEFLNALKENGIKEIPHIAETQTIVYTCRKLFSNKVHIYALKDNVSIAALSNESMKYIMNNIPDCLKYNFKPVQSVFITSLSNVGMILHCAPVLMNIGWIESKTVDFKYYYDGISPTISNILEKMDNERLNVAKGLGYSIDSVCCWMKKTYHVEGDNLYDCIKNNDAYKEIDAPRSINYRYIFEDIPCGLVPIEDTGKKLGISTPVISLIINLANAIFDYDFRINGRKLPEDIQVKRSML